MHVLVIDDEDMIRADLAEIITGAGHSVSTAGNAATAMESVRAERVDAIVCDLVLPDVNGVDLLERLRSSCPEALLAVISAYGSIDSVIAAFRVGVSDFLTKPIVPDALTAMLARFEEHRASLAEVRRLRNELSRQFSPVLSFENSPSMRTVLEHMRKVSATDTNVLITGESGTGKELVSRGIHELSARAQGPFVAVNCSAIAETLFESELFGHLRGSYTGAIADRAGYLEHARGGTLFLDEVGDMPTSTQSKFLRVLEQREYFQVGSRIASHLEARVIAATNRDLMAMVDEGTFREDLFYRLNVFPIALPPLRDRVEEIPVLAEHFVRFFNRELRKSCPGLTRGTLGAFLSYPWPGNVRELKNVIERAIILSDNQSIDLAHIDSMTQVAPVPPEDLREALRAFERRRIVSVLTAAGGRKDETARRLGINASSLYRKMRAHGLE